MQERPSVAIDELPTVTIPAKLSVTSVTTRDSSVTQFTYDASLDETQSFAVTARPPGGVTHVVQDDEGSVRSSIRLVRNYSTASSQTIEELSDGELLKLYNELPIKIKRFQVENLVFQRFLDVEDPGCLDDMNEALNSIKLFYEEKTTTSFARHTSTFNKSFIKKSSVIVPGMANFNVEKFTTKINIDEKSDLVLRDLEEHQTDIDSVKKQVLKEKCKMLAKLEEFEIRAEELKHSLVNLQHFKECCENITTQNFARFMNEWSKKFRLQADKIRLRHSSLKVQLQKLLSVLAHKQLIGENLHQIDFENIRVENVHIVEKIEKKTLLLLELKKMTGEGNLKLSRHKTTLQEKILGKKNLSEAIKKVEADISKSDNDIMKVYSELEEVKIEYNKVQDRVQKFQPPEIMEYIMEKAEVQRLEKEIKIWMRRKYVENVALETECNKMKKRLQCNKVHLCWFEK